MAGDLSTIPNRLDEGSRECVAIIETPKDRRNKFNYDPESQLFKLGKLLPEGMVFPFDFGFIPSTVGRDGDPLDIMVLMDEPAHVGCLVEVRLVGVIEADQTENGKTQGNDRLLGVAIHSFSHEHVQSLAELRPTLVEQLEQFFVSYNRLEGKQFKVKRRGDPARAVEILQRSMKEFDHKRKSAQP